MTLYVFLYEYFNSNDPAVSRSKSFTLIFLTLIGSPSHIQMAVGGGDPSPCARVVDDRRDEVGGGDEGPIVVELPDGRIVATVGADEQFVGVISVQVAHHVRELARGELAASTGAVAELCEANPIAFTHGRHPTDCVRHPIGINRDRRVSDAVHLAGDQRIRLFTRQLDDFSQERSERLEVSARFRDAVTSTQRRRRRPAFAARSAMRGSRSVQW